MSFLYLSHLFSKPLLRLRGYFVVDLESLWPRLSVVLLRLILAPLLRDDHRHGAREGVAAEPDTQVLATRVDDDDLGTQRLRHFDLVVLCVAVSLITFGARAGARVRCVAAAVLALRERPVLVSRLSHHTVPCLFVLVAVSEKLIVAFQVVAVEP